MAINNMANLVSLVYFRSSDLVPPFFRVVPSGRHAPAELLCFANPVNFVLRNAVTCA